MLRRVTYTSTATSKLTKEALLELLHEARGYNHLDEITGMLIHARGEFLQVIEGPAPAIEDLLSRLRNDTRHRNFEVHEDVRTQERLFPSWTMGFGDLEDPALSFVPGMIIGDKSQERLSLLAGQIPSLAGRIRSALDEAC